MIQVNNQEVIKLNTQEAVKLAEQKTTALAENSRIIVNSQPTFETAKAQLIELKTVKKFLLEKKESITKPLNEALKNTRTLFKPAEDKLATIEAYLNGQLLKYNQKLIADQRQREEEAIAKLREEEEKKRKAEVELQKLKENDTKILSEEETKEIEELEKIANSEVDMSKLTKKLENTTQKIDQIRTRKVKRFMIVDESLIPREYLIVNEVLVKAAMNNNEEVPGIKFYTEDIAVNSY